MIGPVIIAVALTAGALVVLLSTLGALRARTLVVRLHYLTPITSVAGPLFAIALVAANGWSLSSGLVVLVVALLALTGPLLGAATARIATEQERGS